jgi:hypothetical protein
MVLFIMHMIINEEPQAIKHVPTVTSQAKPWSYCLIKDMETCKHRHGQLFIVFLDGLVTCNENHKESNMCEKLAKLISHAIVY